VRTLSSARASTSPLPVGETLAGKNLVIYGGTGFLGKVLVALLLARFEKIGKIFLVVRPKTGLSPEERFLQEVWPSPCFDVVRDGMDEAEAEAWIGERVVAIGGDVTQARGGVDDETFARLMDAGIDAVLNVAGVVSFTPAIDEAFEVNAQGTLNIVGLCQALGGVGEGDDRAGAVPLLHTSTCYVAGYRIGEVPEVPPAERPFPRVEEMGAEHWDPRAELEQGLQIARDIRARADDGHLKARFAHDARKKLRDRQLPTTGEPFDDAVERERSRWLEEQLVDVGTERAERWGWPNTYTYTKSVGEQLLAEQSIPFTIVRPAIVESSLSFPFPGWNEGINTSAPLIYMALHGHVQFPTNDGHVLDVIPVDQVCYGLVLALAALLRNEAPTVMQLGTGDANGLTMNRLIELTGLAKRRHMRSRKRGNPLLNRLYARVEPVNVSPDQWKKISSPGMAKAIASAQSGLAALKKTPLGGVVAPVSKTLAGVNKQARGAEMVMRAFLPFISELDYRFRTDNARLLYERLDEEEQRKLPFTPHELDWRVYWREAHVPGLKKWVFPHLEARLFRRPRAHERFSDLLAFLDEVAEREGGRTAVQQLDRDDDGRTALRPVTYRDLRRRAHACAARLADVGIHPGARVALVARNSPEWAISFFGVLAAGATVVPLDPDEDPARLGERIERAGAEFVLLDARVDAPDAGACLDLDEITEDPGHGHVVTPPEVLVSPDDVAIIAFTAGTTGDAKPVVLTHKNVTAVLASVAPLFKLSRRDAGLSVLPLHQTFELTCGLLLPLLRGAHVTYVDELNAERLADAFGEAGITAMIGVPQVWEDLERQIYAELSEAGPFAETAFQAGLVLNRTLGKALGLNLGRVLFRPIHDRLGGRIRFMVSTGGHLPKKTADTFRSLGIELKQGYGLTEGAPVVTLGDARGRGRPPPGVEVEIRDATEDGVGEIVTRGDHVMMGYLDDDDDEVRATLEPDGWLRTGDLGRIDKDGRLTVVARNNEVISAHGGHRVYPREIEERLNALQHVVESAVVGIPDGQGGERVAALVVAKAGDGDAQTRLGEVRRRAEREVRNLDEHQRPELVQTTLDPLPRTADHKLRRPEVIARIVADANKPKKVAAPAVTPDEILDEGAFTPPRERARLPAPGRHKKRSRRDPDDVSVPDLVARTARRLLGKGQMGFYQKGMRVDVAGEQHIPWNRQTIVASNHASHLDMGLIKYALGDYGRDLVALAAKDYFFEGKWRRTYFENFTNLRPLDRADNPREAMREASGLLESGRTILLFPEGTRTASGEMGDFRPAVAYLALKHGVDILPLYVEGTYRSMPRGSFVPRNRRLSVRIGPPLDAAHLKAATDEAGLRMSAACQKVAELTRRAVEAVRDDRVLDVERALDELLGRASAANGANGAAADKPSSPLFDLFSDLEKRFRPEEVKQAITYYFSLGQGPETKWTVQVGPDGCNIVNGKLDGPADCVMKTDVGMFTRIVREHYIPQVSEFLDGTVKTNDPELLTAFVQVFNL
jgi:long-chain acyl-CoA synthetase